MGSVRRLPESVRNSVRSGIILFDLTRVVEELIFNSVDAGATKVSVYLGVGTCYVKVEDDGCGISRDGLALLGERYVTSKFPDLTETRTDSCFGFRGEALASISDVSLLEIVTKARGMPNGFRKVLKGSKCLFLGINNDRKYAGTTVIVRDLFYNQPVRRKYMQSSLKKVLDSVKRSVLRIALVHSNISFVIVDIESEDELLHTRSSSSLSLLMNVFGIEDSKFLHELNASAGILKLFGYLSGPNDSLTSQAFQYVYINSRFVSKGPIHKSLNHLAASFEHFGTWKVSSISQKGNRSRPQACPAYILNLSCPPTLYDLTFEPSKTYVEFKDWIPILNFVEDSVQHLWREYMINKSSNHASGSCREDGIWKKDLAENPEFSMTRSETQKNKSSHELALETVDYYCSGDSPIVPFKEFFMNNSELQKHEIDIEFPCLDDCSPQLWNRSGSRHETQAKINDSLLFTSDAVSFPEDDPFLGDVVNPRERSYDHALSSDWRDDSTKSRSIMLNESSENTRPKGCYELSDELEVSKKPFLQSCSSGRSLSLGKSYILHEDDLEFPIDDFKSKRRRVHSPQKSEMINVDTRNCKFDVSPGILQRHETLCPRKILKDSDALLGEENSLLSLGNFFPSRMVAELESIDDSHCSDSLYEPNPKFCSILSDDLFQSTAGGAAQFTDGYSHGESPISGQKAKYWHFADRERKGNYDYDIASCSSEQHNFMSTCTSSAFDFKDDGDNFSVSDFKDNIYTNTDISKCLHGHITDEEFSRAHYDKSICETEWLPLDLHSRGNTSDYKQKGDENRRRFRHQKQDERCRRSQSAPPFYRPKKRFISLSHNHSMTKEGNVQPFFKCPISPETDKLKHLDLQACAKNSIFCPSPVGKKELGFELDIKENKQEIDELKHLDLQPKYEDDLIFCTSPVVKNEQGIILDEKESKKGFLPMEIEEFTDSGSKWRNGCEQFAEKHEFGNEHNILSISSGFLHLAGNLLVPRSIHRRCLEDARVLDQVDKKFIPIVASGTLAVIDQHAADERIQLEELRRKVLSGDAKTVSYLDAGKELVLPEIGHQLIQNYAEQIREWGWICDVQAQHSDSFKKHLNILHQQRVVVTLLAVPCILGVNLSDGDLLEFLEQLADTDGSSMIPPSVLRVLNNKACRGAIMFGDSLLPSECALIVEELKQTSLCFQCAHGRPTTVPLVNLEELHKQIAKFRLLEGSSIETWHGLHRQEISLERATQCLTMARS